jgi:hypothetical protein
MSKMLVIAFIAILSVSKISAQFVGIAQNDQGTIEERKGGLSTYSLPDATNPATDEYAWSVVGGAVTLPASGVTGDGTVASPYLVPFTVGLKSIQVQWPVDDNNITKATGTVAAQRKVGHTTVACPSVIQSVVVDLWSAATITILDADYEICSGDATLGPITVQFTGAPNFDYKYTVTGLDGVTAPATVVTGATTATQTIALPANLVNTSSTVDQTYIVTLTEMNDSFTGLGSIIDATFTITVHPTVETGSISSSRTLTRRP